MKWEDSNCPNSPRKNVHIYPLIFDSGFKISQIGTRLWSMAKMRLFLAAGVRLDQKFNERQSFSILDSTGAASFLFIWPIAITYRTTNVALNSHKYHNAGKKSMLSREFATNRILSAGKDAKLIRSCKECDLSL